MPQSIKEQMAMIAIRNNPAGRELPIALKDSRWPAADGWVKMQQIEGGVNIHYVYNPITGFYDDFKFVVR